MSKVCQYFVKPLSKYCQNTVKILSKCQNIVKMSKVCQNILKVLSIQVALNWSVQYTYFLCTQNNSNSIWFLTIVWFPSDAIDTELFYVCLRSSYSHLFIINYPFNRPLYQPFRPLFIDSFCSSAIFPFMHPCTSFLKGHPSFHPSCTHFRFHSFTSHNSHHPPCPSHSQPPPSIHPHSRILFT